MMKAILNAVRQQIQRAMASLVTSRVGSITSYDPNTFTAKVMLQPDSALTGWTQINSPWVGNGWGMFAAPNIGDQVDVLYTNGDINAGVIACRSFNQNNQPLPVPAGEFWLVHKLLQSLKLTNDGKLALTDGHGATITMNGDGTITVSGPTTFTSDATFQGNVQVDETLTANSDVIGGNVSLKTHLTSGVTSGTDNSALPVPL
jgi:phage baseplate assembly protein V